MADSRSKLRSHQTLLADDIVPRRHIQIHTHEFGCPYCKHTCPRGGRAEGFRKAGMNSHIAMCYETVLLMTGYVQGDYQQLGNRHGHIAQPYDAGNPYHRKVRRAVMAHQVRVHTRNPGDHPKAPDETL